MNPMKKASRDVARLVTNQVVEGLKLGKIPWQKPWSLDSIQPGNFTTKRPYGGVNVILAYLYCESHNWKYPVFATEKQIAAAKGSIKAGSKPVMITLNRAYPKWIDDPKRPGLKKRVFGWVLKDYRVYNIEQTLGLERFLPVEAKGIHFTAKKADALLNFREPVINYGGNKAFYRPATDEITLPPRTSFKDKVEFFLTAYHELTHWSGAMTRMKRFGQADAHCFGSKTYSEEELVAEIGANMLAHHVGVAPKVIKNSQAYINNWAAKLEADPKLIVKAAARAHRAFEYLTGMKELAGGK